MEKALKTRMLASACLIGWHCRYDAGTKLDKRLISKAQSENWELVPVCPEVLGGLGIPRAPAIISRGDGTDVLSGRASVIDAKGRNVTKAFIKGAERTLRIAGRTCCTKAFLKDGSPSCGFSRIKNEAGKQVKGLGVTAACLAKNGIDIEGWR